MDIISAYLDGPKIITRRAISIPKCPSGYALIQVAYAGICGSDLLQYRGERAQNKQPIGHEFSGRIIAINDVIPPFLGNERVCVSAVASCGSCPMCLSNKENLCLNRIFLPSIGPGGFSEIAVVPIDCIHQLPPTIHLQDAAIAEPFAVALHALRKESLSHQSKLLIIGAGTIGLAISQLAILQGIKEINILCRYPFQAEMARKLGVNPLITRNEIKPYYFDTVINTVPGNEAMTTAIDATQNGGTLILCGGFSAPEEYSFRPVVSRELNLRGSICYTKAEFLEILDLINTKSISPRSLVTHTLTFSDIATAFQIASDKENKSVKVLVIINESIQ